MVFEGLPGITMEYETVRKCDRNIQATFILVEQMLELAEKGDADREDSGCGIMFGVMRDSAYKLLQLAEKEKQAHIRKGWWKESAHEKT